MPESHDKLTIASFAVIAAVLTSLLHEGLGHAVVAWLRADGVTQLTSNHVSTMRADRLVDAGGTLVNLVAGAACVFLSQRMGRRANLRYFLWFLGAGNLLLGTGYFLFSGILGLGDWAQFIDGFPYQAAIRIGMALMGAGLYYMCVGWMARAVHPFAPNPTAYNVACRIPYYAACVAWCVAGAFDPLGIKLMFLSTIPASFGGMSGLMWGDSLMPKAQPGLLLVVRRSPVVWLLAAVLGVAFVLTVGRGINFASS